VRLHEKGGTHHELAVHHKAEEYLDGLHQAADIADRKGTPQGHCKTKELDRKEGSPAGAAWGSHEPPGRIPE
jgi:hypothetical protein